MREGLPQQALGQAVVAGVKGGQDVHFLRVQSGHAPLAAQQPGEDAGEAGQGPHVPLPRRVKVDPLTTLLLLCGSVFGPQGVEIVRSEGTGGRHGWGLRLTSLFALVTPAPAR